MTLEEENNSDSSRIVESENTRDYGEIFPQDFTELFDDDSGEDDRFDREMK